MQAEVVDKIVALAAPTITTINGLEYSSKQLTLLRPPTKKGLQINTLAGLTDILISGFDGVTPDTHLIQVVTHDTVQVIARKSDDYAQRETLIEAKVLAGDRSFQFNDFISQEAAIIGLQACFTSDGDRDLVLKTISNLATSDSLQVEDNGVSQTATSKAGVALVAQVDIKPRVTLAPFRTFREVQQPSSEFVLRIRKGPDGMPKVGLYEADGGAWKMDAIHNVRDWLKSQLALWTIVA